MDPGSASQGTSNYKSHKKDIMRNGETQDNHKHKLYFIVMQVAPVYNFGVLLVNSE